MRTILELILTPWFWFWNTAYELIDEDVKRRYP